MKTKSIFPLFLLAGTLLTAACATPTAKQAGNNSFEWGQVPQQPDLSWADSVGSRQMPGNSLILSANSFGAVADSTVLSTEAIQKAIDSCSVSGGGTVTLQPGYYQTGALFVKSGVNLQLDKGVTLLASPHIHHYPEFRSRIAGIEMTWPAAVINIVNEKNASVSGEGTLDCRGKVFWDKYWEMRKEYEKKGLRWIVDYDCKRVRGILVERSSDITLKGFTLMRTGFWGCQVLYSNYCTIDGLVINNNLGGHGPSTDGIDIDSSTNILIENCDVDCNDDNICIKSGRDADGLRVNLPTENIVIRNCIARKGAGPEPGTVRRFFADARRTAVRRSVGCRSGAGGRNVACRRDRHRIDAETVPRGPSLQRDVRSGSVAARRRRCGRSERLRFAGRIGV